MKKGTVLLIDENPGLYRQLVVKDPTLSVMSNRKVFWDCGNGHIHDAVVATRSKGSSCRFCKGLAPWPGHNDLVTTDPEISKELLDADPTKLMRRSTKRVLWVCPLFSHVYPARIHNRVAGTGCPKCARFVVDPGRTDLATTHPELAAQLLRTDPSTIMGGSDHKEWWVCIKAHQYYAAPSSRTTQGSGCPVCAKGQNRSMPEKAVADYIRSIYSGVVLTSDRKILEGRELDIYLPELKIAFEYNGLYYHSEKFRGAEYHKEKLALCAQKGIKLVTIWEDDWRDRQDEMVVLIKGAVSINPLGKSVWGLISLPEPRCWYIVRGSRVDISEHPTEDHMVNRFLRIWGYDTPMFVSPREI